MGAQGATAVTKMDSLAVRALRERTGSAEWTVVPVVRRALLMVTIICRAPMSGVIRHRPENSTGTNRWALRAFR